MTMVYQFIKKEKNVPVSGAQPVETAAKAPAARPSAAAETESMGVQLDELMQARMRRFLDNQIPDAEREADEMAYGITARTPAEVKAQLGERMGADFSDVRFHTGADAAARAEGMGARAYATGRDVYFGAGGFDPAVAAHELVHTAQQGAVESGMATVSAPAGGVQMLPKWEDIKRRAGNIIPGVVGLAKQAGSGIASAAKWAGGKIAKGAKAAGNFLATPFRAAGRAYNSYQERRAQEAAEAEAAAAQAAAARQQPIPSPEFTFNPGQNTEAETADFALLANQLLGEYGDAPVPEGNAQSKYTNYLAPHNRRNGGFTAFKSSTSRVSGGEAMGNAKQNISQVLGRRYRSKSSRDKLERLGTLQKTEALQDESMAPGIHDFTMDMMGQMELLMDDPEMQRYLLGNAGALRSATAHKEGEQNFFGDDHMLASTLLNNLNLYALSPAITTNSPKVTQDAGLPENLRGSVVKLAQYGTLAFNKMNSAHAGMGTGSLSPDQLAQMSQRIREGRGKEVEDEEAIQNLRNTTRREGGFSREEIDGMKEELYAANRVNAVDESMMKKYHGLYQKMRALIAQQQ